MKANITYTSVLKDFKNIKERNIAFNNLDAQSQRLEIAWDALQLVLSGNLRASDGCYWGHTLDEEVDGIQNSKQFQDKVLKISNEYSCNVCQRGAIMVSTVRLGNSLTCNDAYFNGDEDSIKGFKMSDMYAMEDEYENSKYKHPYKTNTEEKLANILCNILVNGNFNTKDKTDYLCKTL